MYRTIRLIAAMVLASFAFETTVIAHPGGVKPPKGNVTRPTPAQSAKPAKAQTLKPATAVKAAKPVKPAKSITKSVKPAAKADAKLAKSTAKADAKAAKLASSRKTATTPATGTATETVPRTVIVSNPLADKIARNPNLAAKIQARLPAGVTLAQASTGFKNQGQFMAAVNVSNNLGIDFMKLQAAMTGQTTTVDPTTRAIVSTPTGLAPLSLGQSIQQFRPGVDADAAAAKAEGQTSVMVQTTWATTSAPGARTTTPSTTTTSAKTKGKKNSH